MARHPIEAGIESGGEDEDTGAGVSPEAFRAAMSRWAAGVAVAAVRDEGRVYATTMTSFGSVSVEPPQVVLSLGAGAQVLPFLLPGTVFGVSILAGDQKRLATVFADSFPVGPTPFPSDGVPIVDDALAALTCSVVSILPADPARLVLARVDATRLGEDRPALIYRRRGYRSIE